MTRQQLLVEQARMRLRNSELRLLRLQRTKRIGSQARHEAIRQLWQDIWRDKKLVKHSTM